MTIGENIKAARKKAGLTQKQLGDLCGMADSAIRRYESGRGNPTMGTLKRIASALQINLFDLIPNESKEGFEHIPSYFSSDESEEREKAHHVEEILMNNALNLSYYEKLGAISNLIDDTASVPLKDIDDDILKAVLIGSFDSLNKRGKYEAVERVAELEQVQRYQKDPVGFARSVYASICRPEDEESKG